MDLDAATVALEASTRLLTTFVSSGTLDLIEKYYATVRASEAKLKGAMAAYRDHLEEA
ncbi:MAG TPA: hypothetical protein VHZ74_05195 [Bryobacteraceae bacterium]|jgi:hypothetical protein|nr:hypothetical protein [Bryobacteraceae bacterium]